MKKLLFVLIIILFSSNVLAVNLPTVNSDNGTWGYILNSYLGKLSGLNATELNQTMVNGTNIYESSINTSHIIDGTILTDDLTSTLDVSNYSSGTGISILNHVITNLLPFNSLYIPFTNQSNIFTTIQDFNVIKAQDWTNVSITASQISNANAGTDITADLEEEVTEGSLADNTIVSADIKDGEISAIDLVSTLDITNYTAGTGITVTNHVITNTVTDTNTLQSYTNVALTNQTNDFEKELTIGGGAAGGGTTLEPDGDMFINGTLSVMGNLTTVNVNQLNVNGSIVPAFNNLFDLGSGSFRYNELFVTTLNMTTKIINSQIGLDSIDNTQIIDGTITSADLVSTLDVVNYTAGTGITVTDHVITNTVTDTNTLQSYTNVVLSNDSTTLANTWDVTNYTAGTGISILNHVITNLLPFNSLYIPFTNQSNIFTNTQDFNVIKAQDWSNVSITTSQISDANAGTDITADLEEEVTEGSLADSTIVSADIKDETISAVDLSSTLDVTNYTAGTGITVTDHVITNTVTDTTADDTTNVVFYNNSLLNDSYVINTGDTIFGNLEIIGELNITQGINLSQYPSCTALETDSNGNLICGTDDVGSDGAGDLSNYATTNESVGFSSELNISGDLNLLGGGLINCNGKLITDATGNVTCGVDGGGSGSGMDYTNIAMLNESTLNDTYVKEDSINNSYLINTGDTMAGNLNMGNNNISDIVKLQGLNGSAIIFEGSQELRGTDYAVTIHNNQSVAEGAIMFAVTGLGNETYIMAQAGRNNSAGILGNSWMIIPNDIANKVGNDATDFSDCLQVYDYYNKTARFACDTGGYGATALIQGGLHVWKQAIIDEGIEVSGSSLFNLQGNNLNVYNGSLFSRTPRIEEQGYTVGQTVTLIDNNFDGLVLFPFEAITSGAGTREWNVVVNGDCHSLVCAKTQGGIASPKLMQANLSTTDLENLNFSFWLDTDGLDANDEFSVTIDNNAGTIITLYEISNGADVNDVFVDVTGSITSAMENRSVVSITMSHTAQNIGEDIAIDDVVLWATASATTTQNVTVYDTEILGGTGDGQVKLLYNATAEQWQFTPNSVSFVEVTQENLTVTSNIVLDSESISNWDDLTDYTSFSTYNATYDEYAENGTTIAYQNITNIPTCGADEHLDFDGTDLSCTADSGGSSNVNGTGGSFYGSLTWQSTTNCIWSRANSAMGDFTKDAQCDDEVRTSKGLTTSDLTVDNAEGQEPQIKFNSLPSGYYQIHAKGMIYQTIGNRHCTFAYTVNNGTYNSSVAGGFYGSEINDGGVTLIGEVFIPSDLGASTIKVQTATDGSCSMSLNAATETKPFGISVYYFPSFGAAKNDTIFTDLDGDTNINVDGNGADSDDITFSTSGLQRMIIDDGGNVGIGTTTPTHELNVVGTINATTEVSSPIHRLDTTGYLQLQNLGGSTVDPIFAFDSNDYMYYERETDLFGIRSGGADRFFIDENGSVGIGTASPEVGLQGYNLSLGTGDYNDIGASFQMSAPGSVQAGVLISGDSGQDDTWLSFRPEINHTNQWMMGVRFYDGAAFNIGYGTHNDTMDFPEDIGSKFTIETNGNVGIGTINPTHELNVEGDVNVTGTVIADSLSVNEPIHNRSMPIIPHITSITVSGICDSVVLLNGDNYSIRASTHFLGGGDYSPNNPVYYNNVDNFFGVPQGSYIDWATNGENTNFWWELKLPRPRKPNTLIVSGRDGGSEVPDSWKLEGSDDGVTWTVVLANTTTTPMSAAGTFDNYDLDLDQHYQYFRMYADNGTGANPGMSMFQLFETI
jgi:hypothetical protein